MTQRPENTTPHSNGEQNETPQREESLAERSARLEAEASKFIREAQEQDPLSPEEDPLYNEDDPLSAADGHTVILRLQTELDETKDKMIRAVAEAENTRRRAAKEREDARKYSIASFSKDLVNVADNLRRALEAVPTELLQREDQLKGLVDGIEATERELLRAFEKNGIQKLIPAEEIFDPNLHEVMFEAPNTGKPAGTIIQIIEAGYMLHDRLLRPARVGVAKDDGNGAPPETVHIDTQA